jgi:hypothetical protein
MHPRIAAAFGQAPHLLTRRAAQEAGLTDRAIDQLVRSGNWVAIRRGVYADPSYVASLKHRSARQRLHDDAAALATRIVHIRSHESAAVLWNMQVLLPRRPTAHLTVPLPPEARNAPQRSRMRSGAKHHLAPYDDRDKPTEIDGIPVLGLARTAADIAREHGLAHGVVAMDSALRAGVSRSELEAVPDRMWCWPNISIVRQAIDLSDPFSESIVESLGRLLVEALGRGRPQTQFGLSCDGVTRFADLRLGRQLIEGDGQLKYLPGGPDPRTPSEILWDEKLRQDWFGGFKLGTSRLTWPDVWPLYQPRVLARLDREISDTERRFGTDISDLAPYIVQRQARRRAA